MSELAVRQIKCSAGQGTHPFILKIARDAAQFELTMSSVAVVFGRLEPVIPKSKPTKKAEMRGIKRMREICAQAAEGVLEI